MIDHDRYAGIYSTCWCRRKVSSNMTHDILLISCWPSILLFYSAQCPVCGHLRNCLAAEILDGLIMKFRLIRFHRFHRLKNLEHQVCYFHLFSWFPHVVSSIFMFFFMQAGIPHIPEMPKQSKTPVHQSHPKISTRLWETSKANSKPFKVYCICSDILTQHDVCASWHTCFCRDSACADPICRQKGSKFSLSGMTCAVTPPRIPTVMQQVFHGYPIKPFKADSTLGMAFAKVLLEVVRLRQIKMMVKDGQGMSRNVKEPQSVDLYECKFTGPTWSYPLQIGRALPWPTSMKNMCIIWQVIDFIWLYWVLLAEDPSG